MHDIFCFTDIHGNKTLFDAIMNFCKEQDDEASIIFCGDACDRGPDGYSIMKELLDNPHVLYLKGNHEDMFVKAAYEIKEKFNFTDSDEAAMRKVLTACRYFDYKYENIQLALNNGGMTTLVEWIKDGMPMDFVERIDQLPLTFSTDTCDFCHAAGVYGTFKEVADAEYYEKEVNEYAYNSLLWSRTAFEYGWAPNRIAIFGHTPIPYLLEDLEVKWDENKEIEPYKYIGTFDPNFIGAKIDMDTGAAFTGIAYVLNVLTMKAQGFKLKDNQVEKIEMIQF